MRKSLFLVAGTVLFGMLAFTSCDKDDKKGSEVIAPVKAETLWNSTNGLVLAVDGNDIIGGSVLYTPDKNDATKASLLVKGEIMDISSLLSFDMDASKAILEAATLNVLPGQPSLEMGITMEVADGIGSFEGRGESEYCTYSYKGQVSEAGLNLAFTDVALKNQTLAGTEWNLRSPNPNLNLNTIDIECSDPKSQAASLVGLISMLRPFLTINTVADEKVSVDMWLCEALSSLRFYENGAWNFYFKKPFTNQIPSELPKTCLNYVLGENNTMRMYVNVGNIIRSLIGPMPTPTPVLTVKSGISDNMSAMITSQISGMLVQYLMDGIPFMYEMTDKAALKLTIDPTFVSSIMSIVLPLLQEPEVQSELMTAISENPDMAMLAALLPDLLKSLPTELDADILISINFVAPVLV